MSARSYRLRELGRWRLDENFPRGRPKIASGYLSFALESDHNMFEKVVQVAVVGPLVYFYRFTGDFSPVVDLLSIATQI